MLVVRDIFTTKPGQASKFAKLFKKAVASELQARVLTDLVGNYNTVVMEYQVKDLAEFERKYNEYRSGKLTADPELAKEMANYAEMWQSGKREIFQIVE
jgi:hypothetical protein